MNYCEGTGWGSRRVLLLHLSLDFFKFRKLRVAHFSRVVELFFVLSKRPTGSGSNRDFSLSVLKIKKLGAQFFFNSGLLAESRYFASIFNENLRILRRRGARTPRQTARFSV